MIKGSPRIGPTTDLTQRIQLPPRLPVDGLIQKDSKRPGPHLTNIGPANVNGPKAKAAKMQTASTTTGSVPA